MLLRVSVRSVTFRNPQNDWCVLRVIEENSRELVTVTGVFPDLEPGCLLELQGEWADHPRFGRQFQVQSSHPVAPQSDSALVHYLSSGLFPGIGLTTARKIAEHFGEQAIEILDRFPEQLSQIKGLRGKRLKSFLQAWNEQRDARATFLFLYEHQITGSTANKLWKRYGQDTVRVIREDPYLLADEVWGIGFTRADDIALKLGWPKDSPRRLQAGILHTLIQASTQGHVYLPADVLLAQSASILHLPTHDDLLAEAMRCALHELVRARMLVDQDDGIWLPALRQAERSLAERIRHAAMRAPPHNDREHEEQWLKEFEEQNQISFSEEQFKGICQAVRSPFFILTGGPGTGKTTTLKGVLHLLDHLGDTVVLAAPTGRAARRMAELTGREAQTLHRLLEIKPGISWAHYQPQQMIRADCVVVDEFSMVDTWIAGALMRAAAPHTRFLFIGDQDQLPSIGPGNILRELLSCPQIPAMRLNRIYRQANNSDIAFNAQRVIQGHMPDLHSGKQFHVRTFAEAGEALEHLRDIITREAQSLLSEYDIQVLTPMHRGPLGTRSLNRFMQDLLNPRGQSLRLGDTVWRVGDRVMQFRNNYELDIFNGDIGTILRLSESEPRMTARFDNRVLELSDEHIEQIGLAYACTVHKSQGSEYRGVIIMLDNTHYPMLQRNLLYTAITRAREHVWILTAPGALDTAIRTNRMARRYTRLGEMIRENAGTFMEWLEQDSP